MSVFKLSEMARLKELEDKNRRFKTMYAEERLKAEIIGKRQARASGESWQLWTK